MVGFSSWSDCSVIVTEAALPDEAFDNVYELACTKIYMDTVNM